MKFSKFEILAENLGQQESGQDGQIDKKRQKGGDNLAKKLFDKKRQ